MNEVKLETNSNKKEFNKIKKYSQVLKACDERLANTEFIGSAGSQAFCSYGYAQINFGKTKGQKLIEDLATNKGQLLLTYNQMVHILKQKGFVFKSCSGSHHKFEDKKGRVFELPKQNGKMPLAYSRDLCKLC